ncbi:MAG: hypothetical protein IT458_04600 [Planctomycetes bacterium]|nr:hypothetical protein [Planctomycetota bacterium]
MKRRAVLTVIWLVGFLLSIALAELYLHRRDADGLRILLPEDRLPVMQPVFLFFGGYLGGILGFWFLRPFKSAKSDEAERFRFFLALVCTLIFVLTFVFFVAYVHLFGPEEGGVRAHVGTGVTICGWMSFVVAPVNLYYFGMKAGRKATT